MKMLLSLLSVVTVTLAYPHTDSQGPKLLTDPTPKSLTTIRKEEDIATNLNETITDTKKREKCQCMPYYLCDDVDIEYEPNEEVCDNVLDLCCKNSKSEERTTPIPKVKRGCGYQKPHGLQSSKKLNYSGETPWVVALMVGNTTVGAGALVHPQVVLTAAHVAEKYSKDSLLVRAGSWHTQTDNQRLKPQQGPVEKIKIHNNFNKGNLLCDIALLHLKTPMKLEDHIDVICLPDQDEDFDHSRGCTVSGWERDDFGAVKLKKVQADILDSESCNAKLKLTRLGKWFKLHKSFVCAEETQGFTCKGDGGAPLVCPGVETYKVCGLVAWGLGCGDDVPAVYAKVGMFREWVDDTMREWGFGAEEWV